MIEKMNSSQFNDILKNANEKLNNMTDNIKDIKLDMAVKLKIMKYEIEYLEYILKQYSSSSAINQENLSLFDRKYNSTNNESYGITFTPVPSKNKNNVFNVITLDDGAAYFRDIMNVTINEVKDDKFKDIFKHDSISDKTIYFNEFYTNTVEMTVEIDPLKSIGVSNFNMIEIDSYLNGSFDIESIKIYVVNKSDKIEYYEAYENYESAGKMRIILNKSYTFYKIVFRFKLKYSVDNGKNIIYPFGLKHIYLYNANFLSNSYAIAEINNDEYINYIFDQIRIKTPNDLIESSITNEKIKIYLNCNKKEDGTYELTSEQNISTDNVSKPLALNTKKLYAMVPIKDKSIIGIEFNIK